MCCIHGICILAPDANVCANLIFHPVHSGGNDKNVYITRDISSTIPRQDGTTF